MDVSQFPLPSCPLDSKAGAIVLTSMIILTGCGCLIASHTWQTRLCWSFARDNGLPGSKYLSQVHPTLLVPVWSHLVSTMIVSILGCLYLGSYTTFNSMVTAAVFLLYASYSSPVIWLLIKGRSNIQRGPFWLGVVGRCCNYVLLAWLLFSLVVSIPSACSLLTPPSLFPLPLSVTIIFNLILLAL